MIHLPALSAKFWPHVEMHDPNECWLWTGITTYKGYGQIFHKKKSFLAHRVSMAIHGKSVAMDLYADHMCRNKRCVNPAHLRAVTPRINSIENNPGFAFQNSKKTHCPRGHPLSGENLITLKKGYRTCKLCTRRQQREHKQRKRIQKLCSTTPQ